MGHLALTNALGALMASRSASTPFDFDDLRETPSWRDPTTIAVFALWSAIVVPLITTVTLLVFLGFGRQLPTAAWAMPASLVIAFGGLARLAARLPHLRRNVREKAPELRQGASYQP